MGKTWLQKQVNNLKRLKRNLNMPGIQMFVVYEASVLAQFLTKNIYLRGNT